MLGFLILLCLLNSVLAYPLDVSDCEELFHLSFSTIDWWGNGGVFFVNINDNEIGEDSQIVVSLKRPLYNAKAWTGKGDIEFSDDFYEIVYRPKLSTKLSRNPSFAFIIENIQTNMENSDVINYVARRAIRADCMLEVESGDGDIYAEGLWGDDDLWEDNVNIELSEMVEEITIRKYKCSRIRSKFNEIGFYHHENEWEERPGRFRFEGFVKLPGMELDDWELELVFNREVTDIQLWDVVARREVGNIWSFHPLSHNAITNNLQFNFLGTMSSSGLPKAFVNLCTHETTFDTAGIEHKDPKSHENKNITTASLLSTLFEEDLLSVFKII